MSALSKWNESRVWSGDWEPTYGRNDIFKSTLHSDNKGLQLVWEDGHFAHLREGSTFTLPTEGEEKLVRFKRMTSYKDMFPSYPTGFLVNEWVKGAWSRDFFVAVWQTPSPHWLIQMEMANLTICSNPDRSPSPAWDSPIVSCKRPCCAPELYEWYTDCECSE